MVTFLCYITRYLHSNGYTQNMTSKFVFNFYDLHIGINKKKILNDFWLSFLNYGWKFQ